MRQKPDSTSRPSTVKLDPSHVMEVGTGFWRSKTLLSAVQLSVANGLNPVDGNDDDRAPFAVAVYVSSTLKQTVR